jgi:hypothetical protein
LGGASIMRKAILTAFLLVGATGGPAVGDDLSDRFKNDFDAESPALRIPPAANPDLNVPPVANPASPVVPMPRLRPPHDIAPVPAP